MKFVCFDFASRLVKSQEIYLLRLKFLNDKLGWQSLSVWKFEFTSAGEALARNSRWKSECYASALGSKNCCLCVLLLDARNARTPHEKPEISSWKTKQINKLINEFIEASLWQIALSGK